LSRRSVSGVVAPAEQLNSSDTVRLAVTGAAGNKTLAHPGQRLRPASNQQQQKGGRLLRTKSASETAWAAPEALSWVNRRNV